MTKRCPNILHLTDAELRMVADGVEMLQPDHDARPMQVSILERIWKLQSGQHFINEGRGYFKAACETDDCPNPSRSGGKFCDACDTSALNVCEVQGCDRIPEAGAICNACAPGAVADPAAMRLVIAAETMLSAYGGDVPDWLRGEAAELGKALEPYATQGQPPAAEIIAGIGATADECSAWKHEVAAGDTVRGFADWVLAKREQERDEREPGGIPVPPTEERGPDCVRPYDERARSLAVIREEAAKIEHGRNVDSCDRTLASLIDGLARVVEELN